MKDHKLLFPIIISLLILNFNSGCINIKNEDKRITYEYIVEISNYTGKHGYTIYAPFPIYNDEYNREIFQHLIFTRGQGSLEIVLTPYGYALNITSNENLSVMSKGDTKEHMFHYVLSMFNYTSSENVMRYWFYSDINNSSLEIRVVFRISASHSETYFEIMGTLYQGWQLINGTIENIQKD